MDFILEGWDAFLEFIQKVLPLSPFRQYIDAITVVPDKKTS